MNEESILLVQTIASQESLRAITGKDVNRLHTTIFTKITAVTFENKTAILTVMIIIVIVIQPPALNPGQTSLIVTTGKAISTHIF